MLGLTMFAQSPELTLQTGHSAPVNVLAFSSDGKYLASAGEDNIIIIWDFRLGKQLKILKGHYKRITDLHFSGNSYKLFSSGEDGRLIYWDIEKGEIQQELNLGNVITSIDVNKAGTELIAAGAFPVIKKYDITNKLTTSAEILVWQDADPKKTIRSILKKRHINVNKNMMKKMNAALLKTYPPILGISSIAYSRNEKEIYASLSAILIINQNIIAAPYELGIYSQNGEKITSEKTDASYIFQCRYSDRLLISCFPSRIICYDTEKKKKQYIVTGDLLENNFTAISINANDSIFAALSQDGGIYLWQAFTGRFRRYFINNSNSYSSVCFHPVIKNIMVTGSKNGDIILIDVNTSDVLRHLESGIYPLTGVDISPDGKIISVTGSDNNVHCINFHNRINAETFKGNAGGISGLYFTSDSTIVSSGADNRVVFRNLISGKQNKLKGSTSPLIFHALLNAPVYSIFLNSVTLYEYFIKYFRGKKESLDAITISTDLSTIATGGAGFSSGLFYSALMPRIQKIHVLNTLEKNKEYKFGAHYLSINDIEFNRNKNLIATCGLDYRTGVLKETEKVLAGTVLKMMIPASGLSNSVKKTTSKNTLYNYYQSIKIWETGKKQALAAFEIPSAARTIAFSPVNDSLVFGDAKRNIVLLDYKLNEVKKLSNGAGPLLFTSDGEKIWYQDSTHSMVLFDINNLMSEIILKGHSDSVTGIRQSPDKQYIITTSLDGSVKIWNASSGSEVATLYAMNNSDFIITTPDYYYYATKNAKKEIGFTFGIKFYPFEQYDLQYNRPDIVMERLNCASPEMIRALNMAYNKRLQKSGFTEEMFTNDFQIPEITINEAEKIPISTENSKLNLSISTKDKKYYLDRINVWINDVALYGSNGMSLKILNVKQHEVNIPVSLSYGLNKIRVSCMNSAGVESLRETVEIFCTSEGEKPNLFIIAIGASEYSDKDWNLNYAAKDAQDIANLFAERKNDYSKIISTILINKDVTTENILKVKNALTNTKVNDMVIVFYAGHGLLDENLDYYLATYNINFNNPSSGGLSYDDLNSLLDSIPAREKILLIDACHSGEVDKEETIVAEITTNKDITFRGARPRGFQSNSTISYNNSFELMKELFSDLRKGTGAMVISSAGGGEFAFEGSEWKNGVFTWSFRQGLSSGKADKNKDDIITISELQEFILNNVVKLTDGKQRPTMRQENIENDFEIWRN